MIFGLACCIDNYILDYLFTTKIQCKIVKRWVASSIAIQGWLTKSMMLTSLVQVTFGTGLPEAEHSSVTSVPFLTTIFPSSGLARTLGGTEMKDNQ